VGWRVRGVTKLCGSRPLAPAAALPNPPNTPRQKNAPLTSSHHLTLPSRSYMYMGMPRMMLNMKPEVESPYTASDPSAHSHVMRTSGEL
jgi:hypothetical protein